MPTHPARGILLALLLSLFSTPLWADAGDKLAKDVNALVEDTANLIRDTGIVASINTKLALDKNLSSYEIDVSSNNGVVILAGEVNSDTDAGSIIQLAASTAGVKAVDSSKLLIKKSQQPLNDLAITAEVKGAFLREKLFGETDVPVMSITVETKNGIVYLSGTVSSLTAAETAVKLARAVPGVNRVDSTIRIVK